VTAQPDSLVVIASYLRPEEAGLLRGLLESAGITATVLNDVLVSHHPWAASGVAKLAVFEPDVERAREIVKSAGVFAGAGPDEPVEIPEEEWSRTPEPRRSGMPARPGPASSRGFAVATAVAFALVLAVSRCAAGAAERQAQYQVGSER
jgi:hypothetical protein